MQFFGGDHRKAICQVEAHLISKHRFRTRPGAVALVRSVLENVPHQVQVSVHTITQPKAAKEALRPSSIGSCKVRQEQHVAGRARVCRISEEFLAFNFIKQALSVQANIFDLHAFAGITAASETA